MERELDGKVALVLGGSRGIGAAIVDRLARDGAQVAFTFAASPEQAAVRVLAIAEQGDIAAAFQADSADPAQIKAAIDQTLARFGRLDILVVNAGVLRLGTIDQLSLDDFDTLVAVNIRGVFAAIHHAAPHLADGGRIVTIGSNSAERVGVPGGGAYAMTKAAVASLVRGAAIDLAPRAITVNNVQPGPTVTDMTDGLADLVKPMIPLGRMGETREIAGLVAYLVSNESGFMTGSSLTIDGGYVA
jgi:3-oxoacyl-[acyl-carrier protein] reductase